jgi:anti-sigma regulatory factor (Ser/Thr protein kinase)
VALDVVVGGMQDLGCLRGSVGEFAGAVGACAGDAVLAVNELATNSLRYGGGCCRVRGALPSDLTMRVEVTDRGGVEFEFPSEISPPSAVNGRGLMIVRAITSRCGITFAVTSTTVWFELDVDGSG